MSDSDRAWKKHLLRTSVPLEHEVARALAKNGFGVSADYSYHRLDAGVEKEFSVDVRGVKGTGTRDQGLRDCLLDVFVECKYRDRGINWIFLPSPRFSSSKLHDGIDSVDLFSTKFVHDRWSNDDPTVMTCYSAVEVAVSDGNDEKSKGRALDSQLRHGVRQLQYALPSLIMLRARVAALLSVEDSYPFFFSLILITNAPLIVADAGFGIAAVEAAKSLADIGSIVPYLIWSADLGPDFYQHCQRQFADLAQFVDTPTMRAIEESRRAAREATWALPSELARRIAIDPMHSIHVAEFKSVIVVNINHLDDVLLFLDAAFKRMAAGLRDEPIVKW